MESQRYPHKKAKKPWFPGKVAKESPKNTKQKRPPKNSRPKSPMQKRPPRNTGQRHLIVTKTDAVGQSDGARLRAYPTKCGIEIHGGVNPIGQMCYSKNSIGQVCSSKKWTKIWIHSVRYLNLTHGVWYHQSAGQLQFW